MRSDYCYIILIIMFFCHIIDDYYLQSILALMKQKSWWKENNPKYLYRYDYLMALAEHAFSWSFMINLPLLITYFILGKSLYILIPSYIITTIIHAYFDHLKANRFKINLILDHLCHMIQIVITWWILII